MLVVDLEVKYSLIMMSVEFYGQQNRLADRLSGQQIGLKHFSLTAMVEIMSQMLS